MMRLAKHPAVQKAWYGAIEDVLRDAPEALGKYAALMSRTLQSEGKLGVVALDMALEKDPDYQQMKARVLEAMGATP
jgi:hypothetical protein